MLLFFSFFKFYFSPPVQEPIIPAFHPPVQAILNSAAGRGRVFRSGTELLSCLHLHHWFSTWSSDSNGAVAQQEMAYALQVDCSSLIVWNLVSNQDLKVRWLTFLYLKCAGLRFWICESTMRKPELSRGMLLSACIKSSCSQFSILYRSIFLSMVAFRYIFSF